MIETLLGQDVKFDGNSPGALISWGQLIYIVELLSSAVPRGVYAEPAKTLGYKTQPIQHSDNASCA
jgi:hypothetical protein